MRRGPESWSGSSGPSTGEVQPNHCGHQTEAQGERKSEASSRNLDSAVESGSDGAQSGNVICDGVPHRNTGILHADAISEFDEAVATHEQEIVSRHRVEFLIAELA